MTNNKKAIARLTRYRDTLSNFATYGCDTFFSSDLAKTLGLTAAQIRKDFSIFKLSGKKKVGYPVRATIARIEEILGKNQERTAVLCGLDDLGKALLSENILSTANVRIVAAFDERHQGKLGAVPVYPLDRLAEIVKNNHVRFGVIAAANGKAQRFLDHLVIAGVKGILSLSPMELKAPKQCFISRVNLAAEMQNLLYFTERKIDKERPL